MSTTSSDTPTPSLNRAWQITDEDIELVLVTHRVNPTQEAIDNVRAALDVPAIVSRLLTYTEFDVQCDSALSDIEDVILEEGIVDPNTPKQFDRPAPAVNPSLS